MPSIKLQSSDGKVFDVDAGIASVSDTIKSSLEDLSIDERGDQVVSLPNVSSDILEKVISWVTRHKDDPPPPADNDPQPRKRTEISPWDAEFLKVDQKVLFELIEAASYLNIKGLMDVMCKSVADMIKGKKPEEIRKLLSLPNDLTPEDHDAMYNTRAWSE